MGKQNMVCGVDCHPGDRHCNGYCTGEAKLPPAATETMVLDRASEKAHRILDDATKAWHAYAVLCDGADRIKAFDIFENLRRARHVA